MEDTINSLALTLFSIYLPIQETSARIAISLAISKIFAKIICNIINFILSLKIIEYFFNKNVSIMIESNNVMHPKILKYIYDKYQNMICEYKLENDFGNNKLNANKLKKNCIKEEYILNDIKYDIFLTLDTPPDNTQGTSNSNNTKNRSNPNNLNIIISSNSSIKIMESYLESIITNANTSITNKIPIYRISSKFGKKDDRELLWKCTITKLSKNIKNTIVSDDVQKNFYQDVYNFINGEEYYVSKGLPYKRGYILYGEPGCGKTSLIKAIANQYKLPIFIIDMNEIKNNSELIKITNDISIHLVNDQKYLVVFEDIDRCGMFDRYGRNGVTKDCFLNVLDGLDEYNGRITILTANDFSVLSAVKALIRPGRVDNIIEVKNCTLKQVEAILKFYFDDSNLKIKLNQNIVISPAQLIQLVIEINNIETIVKILNKYKNFQKINLEKVHELYNINVNEIENEAELEPTVEDENKDENENENENTKDKYDGLNRREERRMRVRDRIIESVNAKIKYFNGQIIKYELQIAQLNNKGDISQKEANKSKKLILQKESHELQISELRNRLELYKI
jgi:chaperone BCS1